MSRRCVVARLVLFMAVGGTVAACGSDDGLTIADLENPTTRIEIAHAIVPFGAPQSEVPPFPEDQLLAFLECTEARIGGPVVVDETTEGTNGEAIVNQELMASDCAFENGLDEFAPIWTPPPLSELDDVIARWITAAILCLDEQGVTDPPYIDYGNGKPEPDLLAVVRQDPSLEEPLRACMREQGEDFPGDE